MGNCKLDVSYVKVILEFPITSSDNLLSKVLSEGSVEANKSQTATKSQGACGHLISIQMARTLHVCNIVEL